MTEAPATAHTGRGHFLTVTRRLLRLLHAQRRLVAVMAGLGFVSIVLSVIGPSILGHATDLVFAGYVGRHTPATENVAQIIAGLRQQGNDALADLLAATPFTPGHGIDFAAVDRVLVAALAVYAGSGLCYIAQGRVTTVIVQRTAARLRSALEAKLSRLPLSYFDGQPRGEVLSRATNDIDNIVQTLQQTVSSITNSVLLVVGVLTMMLWISPLLALVTVIVVPASAWGTWVLGRRAQPAFTTQWETTGALNAYVEQCYAAHELVRSSGQHRTARAEFQRLNDELFRSGSRAQGISSAIQPVMGFLSNINFVLVVVVGGLRAASGALSIGEVQALIQYSRQFSGPLTQLTSLAGIVQSGVASAYRVFELLDEVEVTDDPAARMIPADSTGEVRFESVSFRYQPDTPLIRDLSLSVAPGQTVAIVGPTGAGKTTLINLLMRFYEPDAGRILVDGVDISTMARDELRSRIGMVLQDPWLFTGTVAENIGYGRSGASRHDIEQAARTAHADRFIRTLPDGYDTVIGDGGTGLSAGETQLITIARAFLADAAVHLLDEATSWVDTRTEVLIQRAMAELSHGRTSFVIAHRLSTIRDADWIIVLEHGHVVEQGGHAELLAAGGAYARLIAAQFARPALDAR